ncbi:hypothetical protein Tco_1006421 [Tanacetum coccineum]|uniref:Uncharacterized protein n=1 Tax=Tanacetum coccineum TaxID=301880 RepID=A0ABQ5FIP2_9ASTR
MLERHHCNKIRLCSWSREFMEKLLGDGASWSTIVEEAEPVDVAGFGETTLAIGAMTSGAGRSTLDGGLSNSSNSG